MADKSTAADQSAESTTAADSAAAQNATSADSSKSVKKPAPTYALHPLQEKAIRYQSYMLGDSGKPQSVAQIIQEAVARQLNIMQKQGEEFPPKMLADLTRLNLIK